MGRVSWWSMDLEYNIFRNIYFGNLYVNGSSGKGFRQERWTAMLKVPSVENPTKEVGSSIGLQRKVKGTSEAISFETLSKSFLDSAQSCQIRKVFTLLTILKTRPK